jgi:hypothetical protein
MITDQIRSTVYLVDPSDEEEPWKVAAGGWDRSSSEFTFSDLTGDSGWVRARPGNCWVGPSGLCGGSRWWAVGVERMR